MTTRNPGLDLDAAQAILQVQHDLIFQNNVALGEIVFVEASRTLTGFWGLLPFARGSVHLRHGETDQESSLEGPDIFSNLLGLDFDLDCLVGVGRFARNFWATKPAEDLAHPDEQTYPPVNATEQEWRSFIKENCKHLLRFLISVHVSNSHHSRSQPPSRWYRCYDVPRTWRGRRI